ncbi:MAG: DoxX family protein [Phycisphaerales bacterium]|nr:DoxX family protein [Phycisphaerales bacterium]NNM24886.1 DoxX family protein [Phycisphaerales bacterium]
MKNARLRSVTAWVLAVIFGLLFLVAGLGKLTGGEAVAEMFSGWGYPLWFAKVIGVLEMAGGLALIIPRTTRYAVLGLSCIMLGAMYTHLANGEGLDVLRPLVFLGAIWIVWWLRGPRGAKGRSSASSFTDTVPSP